MAKNAAIGNLVLSCVGLSEKQINILKDWSDRLGSRNGQEWAQLLTETAKSRIQDTVVGKANVITVLDLVGTVIVPATTLSFVAKDRFVVNTMDATSLKISDIGDNFKAWFLNGDGKIEYPQSEQTLRYHNLLQLPVDGSFIKKLGGEAKAETTLFEMFTLMLGQKNGENGVLLTNGWDNIFYIKDDAGVLRSVGVAWDNDGWYVSAIPVECPDRGHDGYQVFLRNSDLQPLETSVPAQA